MTVSHGPEQIVPAPLFPSARVSLELLKPITWFAPIWAFGCGLASTGAPLGRRWPELLLGAALTGPLVCGASQAVNDWFDREVDAIDQPTRAVPSGRAPGRSALHLAVLWTALSLLVGVTLGAFAALATLGGLALAWAYSAPPLRLKADGWVGPAAVGLCYEGLAWLTGSAVAAGATPNGRIVAIALIYSLGAHGIMTLNDFKSVDGDRAMGLRSLPVRLGVTGAVRVACAVMAASQVAVIALLAAWGRPIQAGVVAFLLLVQFALMPKLMTDPRGKAAWYASTGVSLYVIGMLVSAFALRGLG
jgi:chlorophyll synthase